MIRSGEASSQEVVEAHIERIEAVNPRVNAVVAERFEAARDEARAADARRAEGEPESLPTLLGVPCTVKESIAVAGMPHSAGLVSRAQRLASEDAPPVARLRAAGAIPLGVTNTSEITAFPAASNRVYGRTRNAYDPERISGGSSGGEGAIIGSGGSPFGLGTDIGGSIRVPAFCNGVFGHKPSGGLVPGTGQYPRYTGRVQRVNTTGPLARRAEDLMPLLRILAGPDGIDDQCTPMTLGDPDALDLAASRVIVIEGNARFSPVEAELRIAQQQAAYALAARGARVEMRLLPRLRDALQIFVGMLYEAGGPDFAAALGEGERVGLWRELARCLVGRSPHTVPVLTTALLERLWHLAPRRCARYAALGREVRAEIEGLLGDDGVLIFPAARSLPPRLERELTALLVFAYSGLFNALELPVTQVPVGLGEQGLPLGVQVAAARGCDHLTIAVARALEESHGGWLPPENL
jgi:fatty acid amide hydrolase 2